jgi:glycosyltransferase involved in cell wall biosynthesis
MPRSIAIDYTAAMEQVGGIGRYTRELIAAVAEQDQKTDYRLFIAGHRQRRTLPRPPGANFTWKPARQSTKWFARMWHRARLPLRIEYWTGPVNLLHATDFTLPPTSRHTRTILTVHDLSFERAPETAAPKLRAYLSKVVPRSVAKANLILADSESTRQDLINLYNVPFQKIQVLYSGVDDRFYPVQDKETLKAVRERYNIGDKPFILSVGTIQPRKNYGRLLEAFHRMDRKDIKLVIAGAKGWLDDPLYEQVKKLKLEDRVQFIGFVTDEHLPALYSAACVFAFPSLYEGFGLPPLEAMACGIPVVVSNTSSLPEVVGDAAELIDPTDVDELAAALLKVIDFDTLRHRLINQGQLRAQGFSWRTAAQQLLQYYDRALQQN